MDRINSSCNECSKQLIKLLNQGLLDTNKTFVLVKKGPFLIQWIKTLTFSCACFFRYVLETYKLISQLYLHANRFLFSFPLGTCWRRTTRCRGWRWTRRPTSGAPVCPCTSSSSCSSTTHSAHSSDLDLSSYDLRLTSGPFIVVTGALSCVVSPHHSYS